MTDRQMLADGCDLYKFPYHYERKHIKRKAMFNTNDFKRQVKEWMHTNPEASVYQLQDFCEGLIPPQEYSAYEWLVDQTKSWYSFVVANRDGAGRGAVDEVVD